MHLLNYRKMLSAWWELADVKTTSVISGSRDGLGLYCRGLLCFKWNPFYCQYGISSFTDDLQDNPQTSTYVCALLGPPTGWWMKQNLLVLKCSLPKITAFCCQCWHIVLTSSKTKHSSRWWCGIINLMQKTALVHGTHARNLSFKNAKSSNNPSVLL